MASHQQSTHSSMASHSPKGPSFSVRINEPKTESQGAAKLLANISANPVLDNPSSFNAFCRDICFRWKEEFPSGLPGISPVTSQFTNLLARISPNDSMTIPTSWGGVVVEKHEHPKVEKWLVVRESGYLALEWHKEKQERMEVREGVGVLLSGSSLRDSNLNIEVLTPGSVVEFKPGEVHCLIGCQNLLVWETSTDPKGMDKDLEFIFMPA